MKRGFTLVEAMLAVTILGIAAALAVPVMRPMVHRIQLQGAAEEVAAVAAEARNRAMMDRRCYKVELNGGFLVTEKLNAFDCGDSANGGETIANAPRIDTTQPKWIRINTYRPPASTISVSFFAAPIGMARYRPTGRLWADSDRAAPGSAFDYNRLQDDDVVIQVQHSNIAGPSGTIYILLESHGPICVISRGDAPPNAGAGYACPT